MKPEDIKLIALLDTETTGLDPKTDELIEIACVLYDVPSAQIVEAHSWLFAAESNRAENINEIPLSLLRSRGRRMDCDVDLRAAEDLSRMLLGSDVICAWNAAFDRPWVDRFLGSMDLLPNMPLTWVCAMRDMKWPKASSSKALTSVALTHGVAVTDAHRAMSDTLIMAKLFQRAAGQYGANIGELVCQSFRPKAEVKALVSFEMRELAKDAGFRWDEKRRGWFRVMFTDELASLPFTTEKVG